MGEFAGGVPTLAQEEIVAGVVVGGFIDEMAGGFYSTLLVHFGNVRFIVRLRIILGKVVQD